MTDLTEKVVGLAIEKNIKLAVAESCTGGLISKRLTDISGVSQIFECGIVSYGNDIKAGVLGVETETLRKHGAVSPQTARQMASGVRLLSGADIGVSTTGIAGPDGGTAQKPVGLVYIGISTKYEDVVIKCLFNGENNSSREKIRWNTSEKVMRLLLKMLEKLKKC